MLTGTLLKGEWVVGGARRAAKILQKVPLEVVLLIIFAISLVGVTLTFVRDLRLTEIVIPGMFNQLSYLLLFSIFVGSAYRGKRQSFLMLLSTLAVILMMIKGLLIFSKTELYLPAMAIAAGISIRKHSITPAIIGASIVFITIATAGNLVNYGRENTGVDGLTISERVKIVEGYNISGFDFKPRNYSAWSRLCYIAPQTAAIDFYNQDYGGDAIQIIHWIFLPRILFPNKPIMSEAGADFHYKITGFRGSSTGIGIFISGYYQLGILGFVFASFFCGWFLSQTSAMCRFMIEQKAYLILPLGMIGLYAAFRIDGEIVTDYLGLYIFFLYPLIALILLFGMQTSRGRSV